MKSKVETLIDQINPNKIYCPNYSKHINKEECKTMKFIICAQCENNKTIFINHED